ncbi:hypothetical protein MTR67_040064 [Solanum verrucosum]|uniref:Uncharacterized protein n=1 Tax=Solanum verrucosum TaxID=315347 RepID=A0AAF0UK55_SOLVR|nr:hypothetical protein MTR67_040064 [Solanum verrucosum]
MARPKVARRNQPPRKRARGIVINEGVAPSRKTPVKLPPTWWKGKRKGLVQPTPAEGSSDNKGIYSTHLTTSQVIVLWPLHLSQKMTNFSWLG